MTGSDGEGTRPRRIAALVLAAGSASRFGSTKVLAPLAGQPVLQHVLDGIAAAGIVDVVVVLGRAAGEVEVAISWRGERRVVNPEPERGLSSSLQVGLRVLEVEGAAADARVEAVAVLLGDQPLVRADVIRAVVDSWRGGGGPIVAARHAADGVPNPVLLDRSVWPLAFALEGDRGMGPILARHPELVQLIATAGENPDVDTPADLARLEAVAAEAAELVGEPAASAERAWAEQVVANCEQVDRVREVPDPTDFYVQLTGMFRDDPFRTDDLVLDRLMAYVEPGDTWLDIGAGAGRFALPIARRAREVIAIDPSPGMLDALREAMAASGIMNLRTVEGRWPDGLPEGAPRPTGDAALMAHVGYDIERIGPFLAAAERAVGRLCVAVMMERQPSSIADVCWPPVHGQARVRLPSLPEFIDLLRARGHAPEVTLFPREPRFFDSRESLEGFLRRQLWIAAGGAKDLAFRRALETMVVETGGRFGLRDQGVSSVGVVAWRPHG